MDYPKLGSLASYKVPECTMGDDDPFREVVETSGNEETATITITVACEVNLLKSDLPTMKIENPDFAGDVAKLVAERMHDDIWIDLVPLIKERILADREHWYPETEN
jgi:hypothetical protein